MSSLGQLLSKIPWPEIALMIALPFAVFASAGWLMQEISGRKAIVALYQGAAEELRKPLNLRPFGYRESQVTGQWKLLGELRPQHERFLEYDLIFPFFYAGAFAVSLLVGWTLLGRPCQPFWALLPALLMAVADWTENLIHLGQLRRFVESGDVSAGWIALASSATVLKLWSIGAGLLWIVLMIAWIVARVVEA